MALPSERAEAPTSAHGALRQGPRRQGGALGPSGHSLSPRPLADPLCHAQVDKKLAALPISIAYPPLPRASSPTPSHVIPIPPLSPSGRNASHDIPLTPRATTSHFVLEDPSSPVSSYAPSSPRAARPPGRGGQDADSRWSLSSYGSRIAPAPARRVEPQETGASVYSQRTFVTQAGNTLTIQSRNPFIGRM